jgi:hypothetical protein
VLADRILAGTTNRHRQRDHYERHFSPAVVARQWLDYFAG